VDTKDVATMLVKAVGLVMFAYAIFDIPYYFPPYASLSAERSFTAAFMQAVATLTLPILVGLLLWFFPATVVNKIVSGERLAAEGLRLLEFERLALTIIGVWLAAYGISDLIYKATSLVVIERQFPGPTPPDLWAGVFAAGVKVAVGCGLAVGSKGLARLISRMRGEG
jgi:hypothetical protein